MRRVCDYALWGVTVSIVLLGVFRIAEGARETPIYEPTGPKHDGSERQFDAYVGRGPDRVRLTFCLHPNPNAIVTDWVVHIDRALDEPEPLPAPPAEKP